MAVPSPADSKRVAVIGAGPSGLVTVKELLDEGHEPACFERAPSLAACSASTRRDGVVWESCRLTSSRAADGVFRLSRRRRIAADAPAVGEYVDYLTRYCDAFGVRRAPPLRHHGRSGRARSDGGWTRPHARCARASRGALTTPSPSAPACTSIRTAAASRARTASPATIMHGARVPAAGAGRRASACCRRRGRVGRRRRRRSRRERRGDRALAAARRRGPVAHAASASRRTLQTSRLINSAAHWVFQTRHPDGRLEAPRLPLDVPAAGLRRQGAAELLRRSGCGLSAALRAPTLAGVRANLRDAQAHAAAARANPAERSTSSSEPRATSSSARWRPDAAGALPAIARFDGAARRLRRRLRVRPRSRDLLHRLRHADAVPRRRRSRRRRASCTRSIPEVGASLGFIGFLRPAFGAIPPLAELQARWFALLQERTARAAAATRDAASIDALDATSARTSSAPSTGGSTISSTTRSFCDALAVADRLQADRGATSGGRAAASGASSSPAPFVAAQYRLVGPHAKPEIARRGDRERCRSCIRYPIALNLYLRWTLSRAAPSPARPRVRAQARAARAA